MRAACARVNRLITEYNAHVTSFNEFAKEIAEEHRDVYDNRSERWQESDTGASALDFIEAWENIELDHLSPVEIVEPDAPQFSGSIDDLPTESE
jgi:hypothetical protein